ncbi:AMIN domain-containing protein [Helicobacter sp. 23-1044]
MRVLIILFLFLSLEAREDPFTPIISPKDSIRPYYGETSVFDSAKIEFPSSARLIKKIEVTFQNIDGSLQTKSIAVSGRIDWQTPLLITQVLNKKERDALSNIENKTPPPAPKNKMVKDINLPIKDVAKEVKIAESSGQKADSVKKDSTNPPKIAESKLDSTPKSTKNALDSAKSNSAVVILSEAKNPKNDRDSSPTHNDKNKTDSTNKSKNPPSLADGDRGWVKSTNPPKSQNHPQKSAKFTPYKINGKSIFIAYQGRLKRHFFMQNPARIVMDFEINKQFYKRNFYTLDSPHFKRLKYGLHTGFLRIVLELNGSFVYELGVRPDGVQINVK